MPMWIDSVSAGSADAWAAEFSGPEGAEVRGAVGAYVVVVARPGTEVEFAGARAVLRAVGRVVRVAEAEGWDGVCLAVVVREGSEAGDLCVGAEEWEDVGMEMGFEVVDAEEGGGRNEFGEVRGVGRVREGLECNDWEAEGEGEGSDGEGFDWEGEEGVGFGIGPEEMAEEMAGMKRAIYGGAEGSEDEQDEERDVEQMEGLMMKMQAMRGEYPLRDGHGSRLQGWRLTMGKHRFGSRHAGGGTEEVCGQGGGGSDEDVLIISLQRKCLWPSSDLA